VTKRTLCRTEKAQSARGPKLRKRNQRGKFSGLSRAAGIKGYEETKKKGGREFSDRRRKIIPGRGTVKGRGDHVSKGQEEGENSVGAAKKSKKEFGSFNARGKYRGS